jgi:hypothetical protein
MVGETDGDDFGYSIALSGNGSILAVGAPFNSDRGSVYVYHQNRNGTTFWTRVGGDLDGANQFDLFGVSVSLSNDGTVLAVGAPYNDSNGSGLLVRQVRVFQLVNSEWTPIGNPIDGRGDGYFGYSVSLSADGTVVAGGGDYNYAAIYRFQSGFWSQVGSDIPGVAQSVSLSHDGTVLAVGDYDLVRVYRFVNALWTLIGGVINVKGIGYYSDKSVSLSADGRTVAVGAPAPESNYAAVYRLENDDQWIQVGSTLNGENENPNDYFGWSVSLSDDGTILAVGEPGNDSSGQVRVFRLVNDVWTPIGDPINGRDRDDFFGRSVALSADGTIVAGGGRYFVRAHQLEEQ